VQEGVGKARIGTYGSQSEDNMPSWSEFMAFFSVLTRIVRLFFQLSIDKRH
jgi:hypothetical protein